MDHVSAGHEAPTRRDYMKYGGAVIGGGLLAGCSVESSSKNGNTTGDSGGGSYSVTIAPVGKVTFDGVPESAFVIDAKYADMAVAFGHGDSLNALFSPEFLGKTMNTYFSRLDGVSFDWKGLQDPLKSKMSKEMFYKLDSDVHLADPARVVSTQKNWDTSDVDEIRQSIGPWFGNYYSGPHLTPPKQYKDQYQYYSLWEITEKIARVFNAHDRYAALKAIHEDVLSTIHSKLPPKEERPTAVRLTLGEDVFFTYHLNEPGSWMADTRPLKAIDAFADLRVDDKKGWGEVGYEALLEADPDVILHLWGLSPGYNIEKIFDTIQSHSVGRQLSAIQNDHFYASGTRRQGPIVNLFQLEMTAKQLYPEQFGEWPGYVNGEPYPEIPEDEQLFDRTRVSDIINGGGGS